MLSRCLGSAKYSVRTTRIYTLFYYASQMLFCFIFQALSGLMFVPSSTFSPHSSPCIPHPKFQNGFLDRPGIDYINWLSWKVKGGRGGVGGGVVLGFLLLPSENGSRWTDLVNDSKRISPAESSNILCYTYANLPSQVLFLKRMYSLFLLSSVNSAFWIEEMGTAQRPQ